MIKIKKGLDLPIQGRPAEDLSELIKTQKVALIGLDYIGLKPSLRVKTGEMVKTGDPLFASKENEGVVYTAPCPGRVVEINRGQRRVLESVVIEVDESHGVCEFATLTDAQLKRAEADEVIGVLAASGLFTAFRQRPFSRVPQLTARPHSIFVTSINSDPLGFNPEIVIKQHIADFTRGLIALTRITQTKVYNIVHESFAIELPPVEQCQTMKFGGKHPCGLVGTHIHMIDPAHELKSVWHIAAQDVIAIGKLLATGKLWNERYVALGGPLVKEPRIIHTTIGADLAEIVAGRYDEEQPQRVISGSIFNGRRMEGSLRFLGRYHCQIAVLAEDTERKLLGWIRPGASQHSAGGTFLSHFLPAKLLNITSKRNGGIRPVVPTGVFEKIMPLDILPTQLAKALLTQDLVECLRLGVLELDEEDLSLMTYSCSGKNDYGALLRQILGVIFKEGA
ncbi:MAG: Na(+)-translocating NADH-quinone reductase subunit A [Kiritimatiellae bacterium]|nr:Na(+)-translocating NADH-quinone reductase subunit A [Kiritimatiellia bacterium]